MPEQVRVGARGERRLEEKQSAFTEQKSGILEEEGEHCLVQIQQLRSLHYDFQDYYSEQLYESYWVCEVNEVR